MKSVSCLATFPSSWDTGDDNIVPSLESKEAATSLLQGVMSMRRSDLICTACTFSSHAEHWAEGTWQLCLSVHDD
jgi:hypothetical protein